MEAIQRSDVIIVGAGPIGLWGAARLAKAGLEIQLLDDTSARRLAPHLPAQDRDLEQWLDQLGINLASSQSTSASLNP